MSSATLQDTRSKQKPTVFLYTSDKSKISSLNNFIYNSIKREFSLGINIIKEVWVLAVISILSLSSFFVLVFPEIPLKRARIMPISFIAVLQTQQIAAYGTRDKNLITEGR